jgi:hypothetical protein
MQNNKFFLHENFAGKSTSILVNRIDSGLLAIRIADDDTDFHTFYLDANQSKALVNFLSGKAE